MAIFASGIDDLGGAIIFGTGFAAISVILMLIGFGFYLLSSFYTSSKRGREIIAEDVNIPL